MEIGSLDELLAEARAAGEKIGTAIPPSPAAQAADDAPSHPAPELPDPVPVHTQHRRPKSNAPSSVSGKKRRREVRLSLDIALLIQMQHHCIDRELLLRDGIEAAISQYLNRHR